MRCAAFVLFGACLLPLVISCGEEEETPCCPESGCLQIHGPSYHCVGGDTPGYSVGATPPVLDRGSLTIRWLRGDPSYGTYGLSANGSDHAAAYAFGETDDGDDGATDAGADVEDGATDADEADAAGLEARTLRTVASVTWTKVDVDPNGTLLALRGSIQLCDAEEEKQRRDDAYPEWDARAWLCVSPTGESHPSRRVEISSVSVHYETTSLVAPQPRATLAMESIDGTIDGTVTMRWNAPYEVPAKYEPRRCVDY